MIKEVIVVEGRNDITAVKRAVDAQVIAVGGFGINRRVIEIIKEAQKRQGVIILTDPDFAGGKIRNIIAKRVQNIKHAYITREEGEKDEDIGVENASPESIIRALSKARFEVKDSRAEFTISDLFDSGLTGDKKSRRLREILGKELGIGYSNAATFLKRLNDYGVTRSEFEVALCIIYEELDKNE
ncbi:MAG TPA: ribonuclease M5 [Clostridiaceae bacterium]